MQTTAFIHPAQFKKLTILETVDGDDLCW